MTSAEIRRLTVIVVCLDLLAGRLDDPELCRPILAALAAVHRIRDVAEAHHPARDTDLPGHLPPRSTSNPAASRPLVERSLLYDH